MLIKNPSLIFIVLLHTTPYLTSNYSAITYNHSKFITYLNSGVYKLPMCRYLPQLRLYIPSNNHFFIPANMCISKSFSSGGIGQEYFAL